MPPPRLIRPLRPCQPPWGAHHPRRASSGPRDKASIGRGDDGSPQDEAPKATWWGSIQSQISKLRSKQPPPASEGQGQGQPPSVRYVQSSQPARTDEAPATTPKPSLPSAPEDQLPETDGPRHKEPPRQSSVTRNQSRIRKHATSKGPTLMSNQLRLQLIRQGQEDEKAGSGQTDERMVEQARSEQRQKGKTEAQKQSRTQDPPPHMPDTRPPPYQDLELRQQLQQLLDQVRKLQEKLDPPSLPSQGKLDTRLPRSQTRAAVPPSISRKGMDNWSPVSHRTSKTRLPAFRSSPPSQSTRPVAPEVQLFQFCNLLRADEVAYRAQQELDSYARVLVITAHRVKKMTSPRIAPLADKINAALRHIVEEPRLDKTELPEHIRRRYAKLLKAKLQSGTEAKSSFKPIQTQSRTVAPPKENRSPTTNSEEPVSIRHMNSHSNFRPTESKVADPRDEQSLRWRARNQPSGGQNAGVRVQKIELKPTGHAFQEDTVYSAIKETTESSMESQNQSKAVKGYERGVEGRNDTQRLARQIHTQSRVILSKHPATADKAETTMRQVPNTASNEGASDEISEQSLLEELFPEASNYIQPHYTERNPYPKLDLPDSVPVAHRKPAEKPKTPRERFVESFQKHGEQTTALQLLSCSTELTESDFRRLIPKGKHIETWVRDGEFYKVIPGRDPLSLERLPFYYLLFKSPESALAYQNNAARLHKLSALHQSSTIFSAIPPPKGFLEDGEDINKAMALYLLKPSSLRLNLNMVMQPYNPSLRALIEQGGYKPIVPCTSSTGQPLWKVLLHIEGYEPSQQDLYFILSRHAYDRGISWPFHTNSQHAMHRLRDLVDLKGSLLSISSSSPRSANASVTYAPPPDGLDAAALGFLPSDQEHGGPGPISQLVMNRVYNRWIVEFDEEHAARRFARMWNRRVLPNSKFPTWRDTEEVRMVNAEFLW